MCLLSVSLITLERKIVIMLREITKAKVTKAAKIVAGNVRVTPDNVFFTQGNGFKCTLELVLNLRTDCITAFAYTMNYATKEEFLGALQIILGMRKLYDCSYSINIGGEILMAGNTLASTIDIYPTAEVSLVKVVG